MLQSHFRFEQKKRSEYRRVNEENRRRKATPRDMFKL